MGKPMVILYSDILFHPIKLEKLFSKLLNDTIKNKYHVFWSRCVEMSADGARATTVASEDIALTQAKETR
jgi:hypothetical protein